MFQLSTELYKRIISGLCFIGFLTLFYQYLTVVFLFFYIVMFYELYKSMSNATVFSGLEKKIVLWYFVLYLLMSYLSLLEIQCLGCFVVSLFILDVASFVIGKIIGGPILCSRISSQKTIVGYVGGVLVGTLAFSCLVYQSFIPNVYSNILIAFFTSVAAQLGDLILSYFKRLLKIKDFSNFLPGRGGLLDRFDGLLLSSIFYYILLKSCKY